jgi:hypothetical protein
MDGWVLVPAMQPEHKARPWRVQMFYPSSSTVRGASVTGYLPDNSNEVGDV